MKKASLFLILACTLMTLLIGRVVLAEEPPNTGEASTSAASTEDASQQNLQELTRQLSNSVDWHPQLRRCLLRHHLY